MRFQDLRLRFHQLLQYLKIKTYWNQHIDLYVVFLNQLGHHIVLLENKWVWTYDHHWIWAGNCIGEQNRKFFYLFIVLFTAEMGLGLVLSYRSLDEQKQFSTVVVLWLVISTIGILFSTPFLYFLVFFHTYLILFNFTSVEVLQSDKFREKHASIIPEPYRSDTFFYFINSPFGRGFWRNIFDYFWKWR